MKKIFLLVLWAACALTAGGSTAYAVAETGDPALVQAPFRLTVLKQGKFVKRCFDRVTAGRYISYKVELQNRDKKPHTIDYGCFYLTDATGNEYNADTYLSVMREQKWDDLKLREKATSGLNQRQVRPGFSQQGWIVFEVPGEGSYQLKFRGYLSY